MSTNPFKLYDKGTKTGQALAALQSSVHRTRGLTTVDFTGGPVVDGETVTVTLADGRAFVFEFDDDSSVVAGNIAVDITGNASDSDDADDLQSVMATSFLGIAQTFRSAAGATEQVLIVSAGQASVGASVAAAATGVVTEGVRGDVNHGAPVQEVQTRTPTAIEVTNGVMYFAFAFVPAIAEVTVRDGSGLPKAWDGVVAYPAGVSVVAADNGGAVDWSAADTVTCRAWSENLAFDDLTNVVFD